MQPYHAFPYPQLSLLSQTARKITPYLPGRLAISMRNRRSPAQQRYADRNMSVDAMTRRFALKSMRYTFAMSAHGDNDV